LNSYYPGNKNFECSWKLMDAMNLPVPRSSQGNLDLLRLLGQIEGDTWVGREYEYVGVEYCPFPGVYHVH
jgi:hypothetical protein